MKISFNWLREFVEIPDGPAALGARLTNVGLALEAISPEGDDRVLDLDVTANRGDCLSHLGVAREAAAIYGLGLRFPEAALPDPGAGAPGIAVSIEDQDLCGRYTARVIRGVKVGPSPDWIARRLRALGVRPVNNIADITNYVLLELGHPLHAFDFDQAGGEGIVVRRARDGETLATLDGVTRALDPTMLAIANGSAPIALAGIMGGGDSEITGESTNILLEGAWFDPLAIRRASRALNLNTEASYRFERGTDREMAGVASDRAARLILELAGGSAGGRVDVYPGRKAPAGVRLERSHIAARLGSEIPDPEVASILRGLGFGIEPDGEGWTATVPVYRHDISGPEDLLEELARHWGYDRFPPTLPVWRGEGRGLPWRAAERAARETLRSLGYSESCTLAFSDRESEQRFAPGVEPVVLRNPLSEDEPVLRSSLIPSMLRTLKWNLNRGIRDLKVYEIGKVYPARGETLRLILAMTGATLPGGIHNPGLEGTFYSLKGDVAGLLGQFAIGAPAREAAPPDYYHPGRSMRLGDVAVFGELDESVIREVRIRQKVYVAEIEIERLYGAGIRSVAVKPIPKYPRIRRDFSLLVDRKVRFADVARAVDSAGIPELVSVLPFDRLERGPFPESCYSLAIALGYQSPERTLTDAEVEDYDRRVLAQLEAIGARLRS